MSTIPDLTPWLPVGSLIYIDPSKPLRPDDFVLVKSGRTGRIAIYRGRTPDSIVLDTGDGRDEKVADLDARRLLEDRQRRVSVRIGSPQLRSAVDIADLK